MTTIIPNAPGYLTTMALATRYGVSIETVRHWVNWRGFPADARRREKQFMLWNVEKIDAWLRTRPVGNQGAKPRWLAIVGHPSA
jgi:hypothetical protein